MALHDIAASLPVARLIDAVRWIIAQHRQNDGDLLQPCVQAALRLPPAQAIEVWDAILAESARLPCDEAMNWLESALPLVDRLGGADALAGTDALLETVAAQWP